MVMSISPLHSVEGITYGEKVLDDIVRLYEMGVLDDLEASRAHGRMTRRINAFLSGIRDRADFIDYEECRK